MNVSLRRALVALSSALVFTLGACRTVEPGPVSPGPIPEREKPLPEERKPVEPAAVPTPTKPAAPAGDDLKKTEPDKPLWKPGT